MSKVSEAKKKQNYQTKQETARCAICSFFRSEFIENKWGYKEEKNVRCGIGGFAIKKTAICDMFEHK